MTDIITSSSKNADSNPNRQIHVVADRHIPFLRGRLEPFARVTYIDQEEFTPESVKDADALLVRTRTRCGRPLLEGSRCRFAATGTIGLDHFDLPWLAANGIEATNAPGCNAPGVAQYVWGAILEHYDAPQELTVGVVGCGHVGSIVADWGRKLGAKILICDPPRKESGLTDEEYLPLETVMRESDIVTFHTPYIKDGAHPTHHLADRNTISLMKPGALLINAARGPVVDNEALKEALQKGQIRAVIDTWENEPKLDPELLTLVDTGTPHIAGYSLEGKQRATRMILEAIGKHFGWTPDLSGLAPDYTAPISITPEEILNSYRPSADMACLRKDYAHFDKVRAEYETRPEPHFRHMPETK